MRAQRSRRSRYDTLVEEPADSTEEYSDASSPDGESEVGSPAR